MRSAAARLQSSMHALVISAASSAVPTAAAAGSSPAAGRAASSSASALVLASQSGSSSSSSSSLPQQLLPSACTTAAAQQRARWALGRRSQASAPAGPAGACTTVTGCLRLYSDRARQRRLVPPAATAAQPPAAGRQQQQQQGEEVVASLEMWQSRSRLRVALEPGPLEEWLLTGLRVPPGRAGLALPSQRQPERRHHAVARGQGTLGQGGPSRAPSLYTAAGSAAAAAPAVELHPVATLPLLHQALQAPRGRGRPPRAASRAPHQRLPGAASPPSQQQADAEQDQLQALLRRQGKAALPQPQVPLSTQQQADAEQAQPLLRRRGRPRKSSAAASAVEVPAAEPLVAGRQADEEQTQPRRGQRGRPRKLSAAAPELVSMGEQLRKAGRRRGRPAHQAAAGAASALTGPGPPMQQGPSAAAVTPAPRQQLHPRLLDSVPASAAVAAARIRQQQQPGQPFKLPVPNLGYTCLSVQLQQQFGIRTNRSCRRHTFEAGGLAVVSQLALANCADLLPLVEWNAAAGIHFFRIPSELFPWSHEYELEQLPDFEEIVATLAAVGAAARAAHQRLTAHPSHYVKLASDDEALLQRSLQHLELNSRVFDLMGFAPSHENKINIHIGGAYGSKACALDRFAASLDRLSPACRARLTVENDDIPLLFSIADLLPLHRMAGTPLVFDYLHHALVPGGMGEEEALAAALDTWPASVRPVVHYSEPSESLLMARRAHSYMLTQPFELYGREAEVDVMLEAKGMEQALLFYRDDLLLGRKTQTVLRRGLEGA